mmetsp:Transcript_66886/g.217543  ORF Transcript_66886/g.217543 Transcript_66886/m.217543 type:complete len:154 (-) Transcript_66886:95-556(-)
MGGHGYIAMGLLSLVPASIAIAYLAQDRRFRKGMAQSDAMRCWMCVGSTLSFPLTCGFIGQHKRLNTLFADEIALAKGELSPSHLDRYFLILQLHLCWMAISFLLWQRVPAPPPPPSDGPKTRHGRREASMERLQQLRARTGGEARKASSRGP